MSDTIPLRVMVQECWDAVPLTVDPDITVADLKAQALAGAHAALPPEGCEVKYRGALVRDESRSLSAIGVAADAELIVLPRRRRPVR